MTATAAREQPPARIPIGAPDADDATRRAHLVPAPDLRPIAPVSCAIDAGDARQRILQEIERIRLGSVAKWAATLAVTTLIAWYAALGAFWLIASAFAGPHRLESLIHDLGFEGFRLASAPIFLALAVLGSAWVLGVFAISMLAAAGYNLFSRMLGGLRVETVAVPMAAASFTNGTDAAGSTAPQRAHDATGATRG